MASADVGPSTRTSTSICGQDADWTALPTTEAADVARQLALGWRRGSDVRLSRLDFPGARHHVMNRGARREPIFFDDDDRRAMLDLLADLPDRFGVRVHGYALMPNHDHLMLASVWGELSRAMRHVGRESAQRLNRRCRWDGPVYKGRYRNCMVGTDAYWRRLLAYLHLNPHRAGLDDCESLLWTSHAAYTGEAERPPWLSTDALTSLFGRRGDDLGYHDRVRHGDAEKPTDFDPKQRWAPALPGVVAVPNARDPLWSVSDALAAVWKGSNENRSSVRAQMHPGGESANSKGWWRMEMNSRLGGWLAALRESVKA